MICVVDKIVAIMIVKKLLEQSAESLYKDGKKVVSYSQLSLYYNCPLQWKLQYIDKIKVFQPSIHMIFGTAMHEIIQLYLDTVYNISVKASKSLDFPILLKDRMISLYNAEVTKNNGEHFCNPKTLHEFWGQGVEILEYLRKNRTKYFSTKNIDLVGYELPLYTELIENSPHVMFLGYIDMILYDHDLEQYIIIDFKTSSTGWGEKDKKSKQKLLQVVLYKKYLSKLLGISEDDVTVKFVILRRTPMKNPAMPEMGPKYIQEFKPSNIKKLRKDLDKFLSEFHNNSFVENKYNKEATYPAITGGDDSPNCKWCMFKDKPELCPPHKRK